MFDEVEITTRNIDGIEVITDFTLSGDNHMWCLPLQAIADRDELYGLSGIEESLVFLGRAVQMPENEDVSVQQVQPTYSAYLSQEARALSRGHSVPQVVQTSMHTVLGLDDAVDGDATRGLEQARSASLKRMNMSAPASAFASASVSPRVAESMDAHADVVAKIVQACQSVPEMLMAWRVETAYNACPQLASLLDQHREQEQQDMEQVRAAGRKAGLRGMFSDA